MQMSPQKQCKLKHKTVFLRYRKKNNCQITILYPLKMLFKKRMQNKAILGQTPLPPKTKTKTWENSPEDLPHKKS